MSGHRHWLNALIGSTALVLPAAALAQKAQGSSAVTDSGEIVVTAQKRAENLQQVPISIQALTDKRLNELQVHNFQDFVQYLPSVSFGRGSTGVPGNISVSFRGIATDAGLSASATLPTVGIYLDEQPITSITGSLDIHSYDIARVEALAGPQGTLYGASSEAGTIRIITNKPDASKFSAGYDLEGTFILGHGSGGQVEGFINVPIVADKIALRAVGWYTRTGGYIDSVFRARTFPSSKITQTNTALVGSDVNPSDVAGLRAQLGIDLDDNWTLTPSVNYQKTKWDGPFRSDDSKAGVLKTAHFYPEFGRDEFYQAGATITGKLSNFDITYAGYYLDRRFSSQNDYSDYGFYYDAIAGSGTGVVDNAGNLIDPSQIYRNHRKTTKLSQELRVATPTDAPFRVVGGLFYQRQTELGEDDYLTPNFATRLSVPGRPGQVWLTLQNRIDRDYAAFAQADYDIASKLTVTGGIRGYKYKNTLIGFYGVNSTYFGTGVAQCLGPHSGGPYGVGAAVVPGTPCSNLGILNADGSISPKRSTGSGVTWKANATYKFDRDHLVYATVSTGFRPGGINRAGLATPFGADKLTNYEIGTKNSFMDRHATFNITLFDEEWKNVQVTFQAPGSSGVAQITNAGGARSRGIEGDLSYRAGGFTITANAAYVNTKLTSALYTGGTTPTAPAGTKLPLTPDFKASAIGRYEVDFGDWRSHVQASLSYIGNRNSELVVSDENKLGLSPAYTQLDATIGAARGNMTVELYIRNLNNVRGEQTRTAECNINYCGPSNYDPVGEIYHIYNQPRTLGIRFGQRF